MHDLNSVDISNRYTVSFDVSSLFTNIPLNETLNLAVDLILQENVELKISREVLLELFQFCTSKTNFLFDGKIYDQIDGIAMGSPLAPTLANLFMGHHEEKWIENFTDSKPIFYRRYVDDIYAVFHNCDGADKFFEYLNEQHANIKFTQEKNKDGKLPFLDVLIDNSNKFNTSVYHKPTFTGLFMNFKSFVPQCYKLNLIKTLLDRVFKINNTWVGFDVDLKSLKHYLLRNNFPEKIIDRNIREYLDKKLGSKVEEQSIESKYFVLPYIGDYSTYTKNRIIKLHKKFCKLDQSIRLIFSTTKIKNYFSTKDALPKCFKSHVVYQFNCVGCNSCYVGRTCQHLTTRMEYHLSNAKSSIFQHIHKSVQCKPDNVTDSFKVLANGKSQYELAVKEGLYINWVKPDLNKQKKHEIITLLV